MGRLAELEAQLFEKDSQLQQTVTDLESMVEANAHMQQEHAFKVGVGRARVLVGRFIFPTHRRHPPTTTHKDAHAPAGG